MSSLYELVGDRLALQNKLEELDFDAETIADTLEGDSLAIQAKIESYAFVIRNMEALPDVIKAEEKRLAERRKAIEKRVESIKDWLFVNMQTAGISKIESPVFTISLQNNPASVVIDDESLIPADYFVQPDPPAPSLSKALIKQAIADGYTVAGAHVEQKQRLVIK
jgi:Siphovirus Gp157